MPLTTTSYAILGLLDLRDWSAYDLTQQARRSLAFMWPVSESQLYAEPKRLAREGLVSVTNGRAGPQRTRQQLRITAAGRRALREWLATEPVAPRIQMEALLRTLFATAGTREDLLAALDATERSARAAFEHGRAMTAGYLTGDNPFPERLHVNVVWMPFVRDLLLLMLEWVTFARDEIATWKTVTEGSDPDRVRQLLEAMVADERLLLPRLTETS